MEEEAETDRTTSRRKKETKKKVIGTTPWVSPEIFTGSIYTKQSDIFSLGIVCWEIFSERHPYMHELANKKVTLETLVDAVRNKDFRPSVHHLNHNHIITPPEVVNLIEQMWTKQATDRPTWETIISTLESSKNIFRTESNSSSRMSPSMSAHSMDNEHSRRSFVDKDQLKQVQIPVDLTQESHKMLFKSRVVNHNDE